MSRKAIVILIVITAIFAAIAFSSVKASPSIENALITDNDKFSETELDAYEGQTEDFIFTSGASLNIYAVIFVKNITSKDQIGLKWIIEDGGTEKTIQEESIKPEGDGSGKIVISLAKKDGGYETGNYKAILTLNDSQQLTKRFTIK